jgi:hypothetical protein
MDKPADPATPFAEVYQSFFDDLALEGTKRERRRTEHTEREDGYMKDLFDDLEADADGGQEAGTVLDADDLGGLLKDLIARTADGTLVWDVDEAHPTSLFSVVSRRRTGRRRFDAWGPRLRPAAGRSRPRRDSRRRRTGCR